MFLIRPRKLAMGFGGAVLFMLSMQARAGTVLIGALSYDTFIPAGDGSPGVDAFNLANLSGAFSLPPDFPVVDDLTLQSATLTLTLSDLSQEVFMLGDIGPGFLLDMSGNPVVQVSGDQTFDSAELTANLAPLSFALSDGTMFSAGSASIDVLLLPSVGQALTVDVDQTTIDVSSAVATPEPASAFLVLAIVPWLVDRVRRRNAARTQI